MTTITKEAANKELSISRLLNAPRELVWEVWTKPEHLTHWWGPNGFSTITSEMNVKPGGVWRFMMHGPDGRDYPNKIIFIEVVKPELLVYNHSGEEDTEDIKFHVTVNFEKQGNKTFLSMRSVFESAEVLERVIREYGAKEGMKQTINRLEEYVEIKTISEMANPIVVERTYNAPVEKVWTALTDRGQMKQWYFDIAEFDLKPGFEFQFTGGDPNGVQYLHLCKIVDVIPNKKLSHTWRYDGYEGNSLVTFELFAEGDKTRLRLTHAGLETFPAKTTPAFAKENFEMGWTEIISKSLKEYVEK